MAGSVGVVIATHSRTSDARCSMEIIRNAWSQVDLFSSVKIVHAYNGDYATYSAPHLEDVLVRVPDEPTHFRGAASLIDAGMEVMSRAFPDTRHVIVMASDVWACDPKWIGSVVEELAYEGKRLASSRWRISGDAHGILRAHTDDLFPMDGLATDFFIVDSRWAFDWGLFPLRYAEFLETYGGLLNYFQELPFLERYFAGRFLAAVRLSLGPHHGKDPWGSEGPRRARSALRLLHERAIDPRGDTAPSHKGHWPAIGLVTTESPESKQRIIRSNPQLSGPTLDRLRADDDLRWYNR